MSWFDSILEGLTKILALIDEPILHLNSAKISITSIIVSFALVFGSFRFANFLGKITNRALERRNVDSGIRDSLDRFVRYLVFVVGLLFSLDNLGFSISSLAGLGAVLMVGIGFGLQNIAQNFISGIIILIERPIKVGDIIKVGASTGRVVDIRVRSTVIQTRDDISIIIPNSKLISEEVVNDSFSGQQIRQHVRVGVAYGSEVKKVKDCLLAAASRNSSVLDSPPPQVIFENFGESSLDFDLRFWCSDIWEVDRVASEIRSEIDQEFRNNSIHIPFPQRDLHIIDGLNTSPLSN